MSKHRVKFSKLGMAKYISHLDLLRCFTRAIMRAELPVKYSQGFNPHQKLTFSLPLSIGVTSVCEYADIDFEDGISHSEIKDKLSRNLPPDIIVTDVYEVRRSANDIVSAKYLVTLFTDTEPDRGAVSEFFGRSEVTILKKTKKKGETEVNLMDFVRGCRMTGAGCTETEDGYATEFELTLAAGGQKNLKPEIAVNALCDALDSKVTAYDIHRTQIYCQNKDGIIEEFE